MVKEENVDEKKVNAIQLPEYLKQQLEDIFKTFDMDGKGIVRQAMRDKFKYNPDEGLKTMQLFEFMDTNSDGVTSYEEFIFFWKSQVS